MTDKKHIHYDKILEWAADPSAEWQMKAKYGKWEFCGQPLWKPYMDYRRKPRWFDMEQEWIAKGKPPVESRYPREKWLDVYPSWHEKQEYRFKEVSRHEALKAEWEEKGRPERQYKQPSCDINEWTDLYHTKDGWIEDCDYRFKPTPHPDADALRALAEDKDYPVRFTEIHYDSMGVITKFVLKAK